MKILELTDQKARDLNFILQLCFDKGENVLHSVRQFDELDKLGNSYIDHLFDILQQYNQSPKILDVDGWLLRTNHNTEPFLKSGGFLRLLKIEQREDRIQDFTLRQLQQSIFATKDWWVLFLFTTFVAFAVAKLTNASKEEKTTVQAPIQDSTRPATKTNPYHLDTPNSSNKVLQSDTTSKDD